MEKIHLIRNSKVDNITAIGCSASSVSTNGLGPLNKKEKTLNNTAGGEPLIKIVNRVGPLTLETSKNSSNTTKTNEDFGLRGVWNRPDVTDNFPDEPLNLDTSGRTTRPFPQTIVWKKKKQLFEENTPPPLLATSICETAIVDSLAGTATLIEGAEVVRSAAVSYATPILHQISLQTSSYTPLLNPVTHISLQPPSPCSNLFTTGSTNTTISPSNYTSISSSELNPLSSSSSTLRSLPYGGLSSLSSNVRLFSSNGLSHPVVQKLSPLENQEGSGFKNVYTPLTLKTEDTSEDASSTHDSTTAHSWVSPSSNSSSPISINAFQLPNLIPSLSPPPKKLSNFSHWVLSCSPAATSSTSTTSLPLILSTSPGAPSISRSPTSSFGATSISRLLTSSPGGTSISRSLTSPGTGVTSISRSLTSSPGGTSISRSLTSTPLKLISPSTTPTSSLSRTSPASSEGSPNIEYQHLFASMFGNADGSSTMMRRLTRSDDELTSLSWLQDSNLLSGTALSPSKGKVNGRNLRDKVKVHSFNGNKNENVNKNGSVASSEDNATPKVHRVSSGIWAQGKVKVLNRNSKTSTESEQQGESKDVENSESSTAPQGNSSSEMVVSGEAEVILDGDQINIKDVNPIPYNPQVHVTAKPPYSFSCLIFMAIEDSTAKSLPVKDIYLWVVENFPYYRNAPSGWKNSVRHNLSLNKCFSKVEKASNLGKGSLWMVDQNFRPNLLQALSKTPFHPYSNMERVYMINNRALQDPRITNAKYLYRSNKPFLKPNLLTPNVAYASLEHTSSGDSTGSQHEEDIGIADKSSGEFDSDHMPPVSCIVTEQGLLYKNQESRSCRSENGLLGVLNNKKLLESTVLRIQQPQNLLKSTGLEGTLKVRRLGSLIKDQGLVGVPLPVVFKREDQIKDEPSNYTPDPDLFPRLAKRLENHHFVQNDADSDTIPLFI